MKLDALHLVYKNKPASEEAIKSFRNFYPESDYTLIGDNGDNYYDIATKYSCNYFHSPIKCGYPQGKKGFNKEQIDEYLKRVSIACFLSKGTHIIVMEDDVHILNKIKISESDLMLVGSECVHNIIHPLLIKYLNQMCGKHIEHFYGMGGGTIFNKEIFLQAYNNYNKIILENFDNIQSFYPTIGWTDCILSVFMMLGGASHTINNQRYELSGHMQDHSKIDYSKIEELRQKYSILHHYKKYY